MFLPPFWFVLCGDLFGLYLSEVFFSGALGESPFPLLLIRATGSILHYLSDMSWSLAAALPLVHLAVLNYSRHCGYTALTTPWFNKSFKFFNFTFSPKMRLGHQIHQTPPKTLYLRRTTADTHQHPPVAATKPPLASSRTLLHNLAKFNLTIPTRGVTVGSLFVGLYPWQAPSWWPAFPRPPTFLNISSCNKIAPF